MLDIPLNIFVPQAFIQQRHSKGDSVASCSINATGISLKWMSESGKEASKYVPLNRSNIGIAFTASRYKNFRAFDRILRLTTFNSLLQCINRLVGRFVLSTECYRTRKLGYNILNWPRCSAQVTESLALTDGGFCRKQTLYISDYVKFVSLWCVF